MDIRFIIDALKFFEAIKPGAEGFVAASTAVAASAKAGVYVIKKGAKLISYLITDQKDASELPTVKKSDVVILVDINRRMLADVARYMAERKLNADVIIVTNDPEYSGNIRFLDAEKPGDWTDLVREFSGIVNGVKRIIGGAKMHIFLSTPLPVAFGLGAVWGTVDNATLYHWQDNTYYPAMLITRELRNGK